MFNPSELEGDVDHSFFDSDCDSESGHGRRKMEKDLKGEKTSPTSPGRSYVKHTENTKGDLSAKTDRGSRHFKPMENNNSISRAERKERSRASSVSSVSCTSHKVITDSSDSEDDFNLHNKRPKGTLLGLQAETRELDSKDVSSQSPNETEEEAQAFSVRSKRRNKHLSKKLARNWHSHSPSLTLSETSGDADSESSCSGTSRRSRLKSPTLPKPNNVSLCSGERSTRVGSADSQQVTTTSTDESDDTVTDVSPLASPNTSPLHSLDLNHTETEYGCHREQDSVPSSGLSNMHQEEDSDQDVDECSVTLESQLRTKLAMNCPGGRNRKNYSFTNDEVRRIDRENQRLLRELSRLSPGPRPGSAGRMKAQVASASPLARLSHSALNRQREQQRIERDNLAFLKRLVAVKATPGLSRSEQLSDYQRHVGYLGVPSYPMSRSTTKQEVSVSRASSGTRPVSSRAAFSTSNSSSTPVPRPKKGTPARPAWC